MPAKATGVLVEVWNSSNLLDQLIGSLVVPLPLPLKQDATPAEYPLTTICGACSGPVLLLTVFQGPPPRRHDHVHEERPSLWDLLHHHSGAVSEIEWGEEGEGVR